MARKTLDKWQFGDFQTPDELASRVVDVLAENHGICPDLVIEPTCGKGAFVRAAKCRFPNAEIVAFDVNPSYVEEAKKGFSIADLDRIAINQGDFFHVDWESTLQNHKGNLLILGNPPWVTSSELGLLNSKNLPEKTNFQGRRGIEAITGSGNFDISEWMLLQHVDWLDLRPGALAMLCKYSVARKIMRRVRQDKKHRLFGHIYSINAMKYFSASVDACLFILTTEKGNSDCEVYSGLGAKEPEYVIGERDGYVVRNVDIYERYRFLRGQDPAYIWRSGLKHDCSKVMELKRSGQGYENGFGDGLEIEDDYIYPLLKSSDVGNGNIESCRRYVLVTQSFVGEETQPIQLQAPMTWGYLERHADLLDNRRSTIYRGKPRFSVFGVGSYTFSPWKIAISGFYKFLNFCLVGPINGKPVVFDDTVNFLSFDSKEEAEFIYSLLVSEPAKDFYDANIFWDEKRPITTAILRRLCLKEVAKHLGKESPYRNFVKQRASVKSGQLQLGIAERNAMYQSAANT